MRLKVAAFDVDGTLYPNTAMYLRSVPFGLRHLSLLRSFGRVRRELRRTRPIENFYRTQAELFARERGISPEEAGRLIETVFYGRWEKVIGGLKLFPGLRETLDDLKKAGLKLAVLSDFPLGGKLAALGLDGFWDYARSCEEVGYLKPAPEPFQDLVRFFSVRPEEILYVGNNYAYDIEGAGAQGLKTAHLTKRPKKNSAADFSFHDYRALRGWILSSA